MGRPLSVYRFKVELERAAEVWRIIEIRGDQNLDRLHCAIQSAFNWDDDHLYSFYLSGRHWDQASEYSSPRTDGKPRMANETEIDSLGLAVGRRIAYLFDYGDEWRHRIKLLEIFDDSDGTRYPRIVESHGNPPPQYPDWDEPMDKTPNLDDAAILKELGGLAPLARKVREAIKPRDQRCLSEPEAQREYAVVMEFCEAIKKARSKFALFDNYCEGALYSWLLMTPDVLADAGLVHEAARMCESWSEIMQPETFLSDRAIILAQAGEAGPAREQLARNIERFTEDAEMLSCAGDAYLALKDHAAAESCYRRSLELEDDQRDYNQTVFKLIPVLKETGKGEEAKVLEAALPRNPLLALLERHVPHVREQPKIGRNDPCACGSGKKHKKCCGSGA